MGLLYYAATITLVGQFTSNGRHTNTRHILATRMMNERIPLIGQARGVPFLLLLFVGLGLALRLWRLEIPLFYSDEAFSWRVCTYPTVEAVRRVARDTHPVGHFLLLKLWMCVFGTTPTALRSLSAVCGTLCIPVAYATCSEAVRFHGRKCSGAARSGPFLAAFLTAVHIFQLETSRTARMYALGALFSGLAALCLLRALKARRMAHWVLYAIVASAFLHTHNFALFTVGAQWFFLSCAIAYRWHYAGFKHVKAWLTGFLCVVVLVAALYSPWIPIFMNQAARVKENFWIPHAPAKEFARVFVAWSTGLTQGTTIEAIICGVVLGGLALWITLRAHTGALLFLFEAIIPWIGTWLISSIGERPLLQERYLVFSNFSLIVFLGCAITSMPNGVWRVLLALNLLSACVCGTTELISRLPNNAPPVVGAVTWIKNSYLDGDVIVTPDARSLNVLRFYATHKNLTPVNVRCSVTVDEYGQVNHISSLNSEDRLWGGPEPPLHVNRIWNVNSAVSLSDDSWKCEAASYYSPMDKSFENGLEIRLYIRHRER